ncbi:ABC transporter ATP-binding protein [Gracilibacillus oryzae]|uniref:ABC transporter ATP-binding protein n=1 Tax=Gracilibacillus oryzae TaxID=1672701 RepID=A0A7C8KTA8_9BACI|nr:ABC transporter ATP-binding protein [Gracilibacillus oryzae]KAB8139369.1 ABC transporter ATP-binding protein [Gracilibacillus oryzae]
MWGLRSYIKPYWKFLIFAPIFMLMEVFFDLLQPRLAAYIIDFGVVERDMETIQQTGLLMVLVALLSLVSGVACNLFASRASQNFGADIREALYAKIQRFSFEDIHSFQTGSLITRVTNDVVQAQNLVQIILQRLVRSPSLLIGSVIMALSINVKLGLILLGTLLLLLIVLVFFIRFSFPLFSKVQTQLDSVNTRIQDNLAGIRVVKAFVRAHFETKRFKKVNKDYTQKSIKAARFMAINGPVVTLIMNMCLIIILLYGGNLTGRNDLQVGDLVAFINYVTQALSSLVMVSGLLMSLSQAKVSSNRINEVLTTEPKMIMKELDSIPSFSAAHIRFEEVSFAYNNVTKKEDMTLKDINFEAFHGETIAIIGATGAGKSTFVQLIPRLYDVSSGAILIDGKNIKDLPLLQLRQNIGIVLQDAFLFSGTIRDNISFGKAGSDQEEIETAAKIAQAHDFIMKLPNGYDTKVGQKGINLSGGQKQRISIARTLLMRPPVLILDDSTSALDLGTEKLLREALQDIMQECITFIIAQRISSVKTADKILVIEEGTIVGAGTHQDLLKSNEVYHSIYASQYGNEEAAYVQH